MTLTPSQASLLLIMLGKSDQSAIRPGEFTAEHALQLVERLRVLARADANRNIDGGGQLSNTPVLKGVAHAIRSPETAEP